MSYTKPRRYRPESFGATAALPLTVVALASLVGMAALMVPEMFAAAPAAKAAPAPVATPTQQQVVPVTAPAFDVVRAVVQAEPAWNQAMPLPFGCEGPEPALSATGTHGAVVLGAFVMPAGGGNAALDIIRSCGRRTDVAGAPAVRFAVHGGQVVMWSRGDVVVSVAAPSADAALLASIDDRLLAALGPVCASTDPAAQDPSRNPVLGSYRPWHTVREVRVESAGVQVPEAMAPVPGVQLPVQPAGIAGPPLPVPVEMPQPLAHPGPEPLTRSFEVPAVDDTGPGCGWAFTGATGPKVEPEVIEQQALAIEREQRDTLRAENTAWEQAARAYLEALPTHVEQRTAWDQYVAGVQEVATSWSTQAAALAQYEAAVQRRAEQQRAVEKFRADQASAAAAYDAAVAACAAWRTQADAARAAAAQSQPTPSATPSAAPAPVATPTVPPTPAGGCPAPRPPILDSAAPTVDPEPAPPALWKG